MQGDTAIPEVVELDVTLPLVGFSYPGRAPRRKEWLRWLISCSLSGNVRWLTALRKSCCCLSLRIQIFAAPPQVSKVSPLKARNWGKSLNPISVLQVLPVSRLMNGRIKCLTGYYKSLWIAVVITLPSDYCRSHRPPADTLVSHPSRSSQAFAARHRRDPQQHEASPAPQPSPVLHPRALLTPLDHAFQTASHQHEPQARLQLSQYLPAAIN